jgi:type I restriction enzyme S subunit
MMRVQNNIPQLRFAGFEGEWEENELGNITKVTSGGTPSRNNVNFWNGNIPWITTSLINFNIITAAEEYITQEAVLKSSAKLFKKGTILMAMYGQGKTRGKVAVLGLDATTNQACGAIMPNENLDKDYLFQNLAGRYDEIRDLSNEGGQQNLSGGIIKEIKISFPTLPEQQKIASFLSVVDEKIQQLSRKKELLEQYKKGVMQQLFSGKLRFKYENGEDYPDWEEKKLGDLGDFYKGKGLPKSDITANGKYKCLHYGELFTKYKESITNIISTTDVYDKPFLSIANDVLMPTSDVTPNGLATASRINEDGVILGGDVLVVRQKIKAFDGLFFSYYVNQFREKVMKLVSGSTVYHLYGSDMKKLEIRLPILEEQIKIANFLSNIDTKIENVNGEIGKTQLFKKGLLQKMFV